MTLNTSWELSVMMRIEASDYWGTQKGGAALWGKAGRHHQSGLKGREWQKEALEPRAQLCKDQDWKCKVPGARRCYRIPGQRGKES